MDSITQALVEFTSEVEVDALPEAAVDEVRRRLIDTIGCALVGFDSPPATALRGLVRGREVEDGCLVWGTGDRSTPEVAALINAAAVRYLDFNDHTLGGHPSDNIPGVIAACEAADGSVEDLIAGVLVNYEVFGELGRLLVRDKGWDQGTTGVVASACAAGKAIGLSPDQLANAIGIAAISNMSTRKSRRGQLTMWKGLATPYAGQAGVMAAHIAGQGVTGPQDAFEGEDGFWQMVMGPFSIEELDDPRDPKHIFKANYKYWPVEFNAQLGVWLGKAIHDSVNVEEIAAVEVETYFWTWHEIGKEPEKWAPTTRETADHSLPYTLAVAVVNGEVGLDHFAPDALRDERYRAMMDKISVQPADDITERFPEQYVMRGVVKTTDGNVQRFEVNEPRGRFTNPMSDDDVRDKFQRLLSHSSLSSLGQPVLDSLGEMDLAGDVRSLITPLEVR